MDRLRGLLAQLRAIFFRRATDTNLREEIATHIDLESARLVAVGYSPAEARRLALAAFGGRDAAHEAHRDARGGRWIADAIADARYALRTLRHNPTLTIAATLTIAIAVGANTAIFSTLHAVVLRPLPFAEADRLVMLYETNEERGWTQAEVAPANYFDWREQVTAFDGIAAYPNFETTVVMNHDGGAQLLSSMPVTGNFFQVLGVRASLGRTFSDDETWATGERVAMISDRLWRTRFGSDPSIIDRTITLGGFPVRVVGVVPGDFAFPGREPDIWQPSSFVRAQLSQVSFRRAHWLRAIARLKPGVTEAQAHAALQVVVRRLESDYPETNTGMGAGMIPLHRYLVGDVRQTLLALQVAVGLLMLIACANVGNLLLVRAADRERESVLRLALGAGRGRLVRQAMTESLVLSLTGGVVGVASGWFGTRLLAANQPEGLLPVRDIGVSAEVIVFALSVSIMSGLLFGIGPSVWARRRDAAEVLKEGGRSGTRAQLHRWSHGLAVGEVAIAVVLLAGAGLLTRSWWEVQGVDSGVEVERVLSATPALPPGLFRTPAERHGYYDAALARLRAIPGVSDAATVRSLPMTVPSWSSDFAVAGRAREDFGVGVVHREISPDYHRVVGVSLRAGRSFTDADNADAPLVVLINEALAQRHFPNEDPIGRRVAFDRYPDSTSNWRTIVGVVGNERQVGVELPTEPEFFAPMAQDEPGVRVFVLRTTVDPASLASAVREGIRSVNDHVAIQAIRPLAEVRDAAMAQRRFVLSIVVVFASAGLLLAVIGVYGVMSQLARGRRREIGIRVALGAPVAGVQWLVLRRGLTLSIAGVGIGLAVAIGAVRAVRAMLYGVTPHDPVTLVGVSLVLTFAAMAASWFPARRAARVDPSMTLRLD
ncbi:MAG TPA: ABC transporter permease [Gemmatimonadaceae bacterium]